MKSEKIKNILISGGAGFIGSNLAVKLFNDGYSVTVLDNLSQQIHGKNPEKESPLYQNINGKVTFIKGDITRREDWMKALENIDCIVHLAAETGTGQSMYDIEKYDFVNNHGTALMMDVLTNEVHQVKKIILGSSRAVYGEGSYKNLEGNTVFPSSRTVQNMQKGIFDVLDEKENILSPIPTRETAKVQPISVYALTKYYQEEILKMTASAVGIEWVILRFQNVYGAGQSLKNPYTGILSIFSTQILTGKKINIFEDGKPARDFVEVSDVVRALEMSIEKETANGEIINVGTEVPITVLEVVKTLETVYEVKADWEITGDFRIGDIRYNVADIKKMKNHLDFEPSVTFQEGIQRFAAWVKQQKITDNNYQKSLNEMKGKGLFLKS